MKTNKIILLTIIFIGIIFSICLYFYDRKDYHKMDLSEVKTVYVNKTGKAIELEKSKANEFLNIIKRLNNGMNYKSEDYFKNEELEYVVSLVKDENDTQLIYIFNRNGKKYFYAPGSGTFKLSKEKYERILLCFPTFIDEDLSDFYNDEILSKYTKITELPKGYTIEKDNKDVIYVNNNEFINKNLIVDFLKNYENKEFAFMRLLTITVEGNSIIYDIKYDNDLKKIIVIADYSRDDYNKEDIKKLQYTNVEYKKECLSFYNINNHEEESLEFCLQDFIDW